MRKNLFLYLTLACFFGLIVIFIVDGYMGIYDTVYVTTGEREEKIQSDFWLRQDRGTPDGVKNAYYLSVNRDDKAFFRYEVDNRRFSSYQADIEAAVWHSQEKVRDLISQPLQIAAFEKGQLEWVMDTSQFLPADIPPEQGYQYTVIIKRGDIERKIIVYVDRVPYSSEYPVKPIPPPSR